MEYTFFQIEKNWQSYWRVSKIFEVNFLFLKEKYYILNMFPYPSGAGLHVGHPLGFIIADIYARFKRSEGYNVLHPIGFDSFGLPTEQFALQTGKHPNITTDVNITKYKKQLKTLGFSFDWTREIRTSDPHYYRWTQWIFIQFFNSWYDQKLKKSRHLVDLIKIFEREGNWKVKAFTLKKIKKFSNEIWKKFTFKKKEEILQNFRIAFRSKTNVNWCKDLGTILANDEIKNGRSERGGYIVFQKKMIQWNLRINSYARRLLSGLNNLQWSNAIKEIQRNWIGKYFGIKLFFSIITYSLYLEILTKQPYTIFDISLIILDIEHPIINFIIKKKKNERIFTEYKKKKFSGLYAKNPFTKNEIPIYIKNYVFPYYNSSSSTDIVIFRSINHNHDSMINFFKSSIKKKIEKGIGFGTVNYRLRVVGFSRQRSWGESIPISYNKKRTPYVISEDKLPLFFPRNGFTPIKRTKHWGWNKIKKEMILSPLEKNIYSIETNTMPAWAGSSWYMLRFMKKSFFDAENYWNNVDLYIGGVEHATGHLIYARFWHKFLNDLHWIKKKEPFQKLINQGMILGNSALISRINDTHKFISYGLIQERQNIQNIHIDIQFLKYANILDIKKIKKLRKEFNTSIFITENGRFYCQRIIEKMSKSKYNIINPDKICFQYGVDTFRLYEIFLGPFNQDKPWNDHGINGIYHFMKKLWFLFHKISYFFTEDSIPSLIELKILSSILKKVKQDIPLFSFNTSISAFMIVVNELHSIKCRNLSIIEPIILLLAPFSPYISEELWHLIGYKKSISFYQIPISAIREVLVKKKTYALMVEGKFYFRIEFLLKKTDFFFIKKIITHPKIIQYFKIFCIIQIIFIPFIGINIQN